MTTQNQPPVVPASPYRPVTYSPRPPQAFYQRPRRKGWTPLYAALAAVAALLVLGGLAALGLALLGSPSKPAADTITVQVDNCSEIGGFYQATVTVANSGSRPRTVLVDVEWSDRSSGTRLAMTTVTVADVDAGRAAKESAVAAGPDTSALLQCSYRAR